MGSLKYDPRFGLDSHHSWMVAGFCSWFLFMGCIAQRVFGVVYVGILEEFGVTRQEASWPMNIIDLLASLSNPVFGYLCSRYSCRAVLLWCGLAGPLGVILCYFAPNVIFIAVFYGMLNGISISGTLTAITVVLAQHFEKRRATAYSVVFTVSAFNTFMFPPLVELLLSTYGLYGTFLVLGAICLHTFPPGIAITSPEWMKPSLNGKKHKAADAGNKCLPPEETELVAQRIEDHEENATCVKSRQTINLDPSKEASVVLTASNEEECRAPSQATDRDNLRNFVTVRFWVDSLSFSVMYLALSLFLTLAVDMAKDKGVSTMDAVFIFHAFSAGDVIFRGVSGVLLDSKFLSSDGVMLLGFILQGVGIEILAFTASFPLLIVGSLVFGCGNGLRMPIAGVVLIGDFGLKALPIVFGGFALVCGLNVWTRAPLIGYFRDQRGTYDGVLHVLGVCSFACVAVWAVRICLKRWRTTRLPATSAK
ncbi:monocarboxylate transporter 9-like [Amblyomma americanum]